MVTLVLQDGEGKIAYYMSIPKHSMSIYEVLNEIMQYKAVAMFEGEPRQTTYIIRNYVRINGFKDLEPFVDQGKFQAFKENRQRSLENFLHELFDVPRRSDVARNELSAIIKSENYTESQLLCYLATSSHDQIIIETNPRMWDDFNEKHFQGSIPINGAFVDIVAMKTTAILRLSGMGSSTAGKLNLF